MFHDDTAHSETTSSSGSCPFCSARWSYWLQRPPGLRTKHGRLKRVTCW